MRAAGKQHAPMSESALQGAVLELARALGWLCYHTHDSRRSAPGFPDLLCARRERLVVAELKSDHGSVSREQFAWMGALADVGAEVQVWRPADWRSGAVEAVLR